MLPSVKPQTPIINWGHPLTRGLVFHAGLAENAGLKTFDAVNKIQGTIAANGATWDKNVYGTDLNFNTAASLVTYTTPAKVNSLAPYSIVTLLTISGSGGGGFGRVISKGAGATEYFTIDNNNGNVANTLLFLSTWTTSAAAWNTNAIPNFLNTWHMVVVTYSGTLTTHVPLIYVDGVLNASNVNSAPLGSPPTDTTNLSIGNRSDATRNWTGKVAFTSIYNRILSPQEVRQLYLNPWQIYKKMAYKPL